MQTRSRVPCPAAATLTIAAAIFLPAWYSQPKCFGPLAQPVTAFEDAARFLFGLKIHPEAHRGDRFRCVFADTWLGRKNDGRQIPEAFRHVGLPVEGVDDSARRTADGRVAAKGDARPRRSIRIFDERAEVGAPYSTEILEAAKAHRVHPALIAAVIRAESNFVPLAISRNGAQGLMQLMPATARRLGVECAFDPRENIRGGTAYLAELADRFGETAVELILAAYNAGERSVDEFGGIPPYEETRAFVKRVSALWQEALAAHPAS